MIAVAHEQLARSRAQVTRTKRLIHQSKAIMTSTADSIATTLIVLDDIKARLRDGSQTR